MNNLEQSNQQQDRMDIPESYEAPAIEVIEVEVERGFEESDGDPARRDRSW